MRAIVMVWEDDFDEEEETSAAEELDEASAPEELGKEVKGKEGMEVGVSDGGSAETPVEDGTAVNDGAMVDSIVEATTIIEADIAGITFVTTIGTLTPIISPLAPAIGLAGATVTSVCDI
ncbi:hypothetical protein HK101_004443, partial [Irineochytrium annulatum]